MLWLLWLDGTKVHGRLSTWVLGVRLYLGWYDARVTSNLQVNELGVRINGFHQLPNAWSIFILGLNSSWILGCGWGWL